MITARTNKALNFGFCNTIFPYLKKETGKLISFAKDKIDFLNLNELEYSEINSGQYNKRELTVKDELSYGIAGSEELALELLEMFPEMNIHYCTARLKDSVQLAATSPALHADKIKAPLFVAQGANDPRVNKNESDQIVKALKDRNVEVEYMVKDNEGHGFHNEENRFDFYRAMETFLNEQLKEKKK